MQTHLQIIMPICSCHEIIIIFYCRSVSVYTRAKKKQTNPYNTYTQTHTEIGVQFNVTFFRPAQFNNDDEYHHSNSKENTKPVNYYIINCCCFNYLFFFFLIFCYCVFVSAIFFICACEYLLLSLGVSKQLTTSFSPKPHWICDTFGAHVCKFPSSSYSQWNKNSVFFTK